MTSISLALHVLAAVIWVGGMFTIYVCLRPALSVLEQPSDRVKIAAATFAKFFPWVWLSIVVLFISGYLMLFTHTRWLRLRRDCMCTLCRAWPGSWCCSSRGSTGAPGKIFVNP